MGQPVGHNTGYLVHLALPSPHPCLIPVSLPLLPPIFLFGVWVSLLPRVSLELMIPPASASSVLGVQAFHSPNFLDVCVRDLE